MTFFPPTVTSFTGAGTAKPGFNLASDASGSFSLALPAAAAYKGQLFIVMKTNSSANTVTIDPSGSETINGATTIALTSQYESAYLLSDGTNWKRITSSSSSGAAPDYNPISKSSNFTASDGTGSYYRVTTSGGAVTATLPTSPADGTVLKFKCLDAANNLTLSRSSSDIIDNAGVTDTTLVVTKISGVVELIAVSGGWDVT